MASEVDGPVRVTIRNQVLHAIDARLFGQFMERPSWGGEIGVEAAVVPGTHELQPEAKRLLRAMQIPLVRFPGGTDVDYIDWRDMISNVPGRSAERPITTGHTGNRVTNFFGYDEFLRLCEELRMEPVVVVNFRDGLLSKAGPQQAARRAAMLAAYCNAAVDAPLPEDLAVWPRLRAKNGHAEPYRVKFFQIGNETWAFSGKASEADYRTAIEAYVAAIRAVDPSARIIVDGQPPKLAERVFRELGAQIDYFAVHHYQPWQIREARRGEEIVDAGRLSAEEIWYAWVTLPATDGEGQSVLVRDELEQARRLGYRVAMTEWNWNGWWGPSLRGRVALDSLLAKGLGAAGILHAILRQGDVVDMAAQSMLIGDGWGIHAIYCDRQGRKPSYLLPSGQVTMLYSQHHGNQRLAVELENMPHYDQPYRMAGIPPARRAAYLDVVVTRGGEAVYLHAINRHFQRALTAQVDVSSLEWPPAARGTLHVLEGRLANEPASGDSPAPGVIRTAAVDIPGVRFDVRLPARSVSVLVIPLISPPQKKDAQRP